MITIINIYLWSHFWQQFRIGITSTRFCLKHVTVLLLTPRNMIFTYGVSIFYYESNAENKAQHVILMSLPGKNSTRDTTHSASQESNQVRNVFLPFLFASFATVGLWQGFPASLNTLLSFLGF